MEKSHESRAARRAEMVIDALATAGIVSLTVGVAAQYGWPFAAIADGVLLLALAGLAILRGGA